MSGRGKERERVAVSPLAINRYENPRMPELWERLYAATAGQRAFVGA